MNREKVLLSGYLATVAGMRQAGLHCFEENGVFYQRIGGGANNALYRIEDGERIYALKMCIRDERHRASREFNVMRLLQSAHFDLAPRVIALDESGAILPTPAVLYEWLPGETLRPPLSHTDIVALVESIQRMHECRYIRFPNEDITDAWFHWFQSGPYLEVMTGYLDLYGPWLDRVSAHSHEMYGRLSALLSECQAFCSNNKVDLSRQSLTLCLCHVDMNLSNAILGVDGKVRWVDWEYAGWGDPAMEVADLRWHASLEALSVEQLNWLRKSYRPPERDDGFWRRVNTWDRILSVHWPLLVVRWLYSLEHGPDRPRLTQPEVEPQVLWDRLTRFIERAERWESS